MMSKNENRWQKGYSLPQAMYLDEDIYAADVKWLMTTQWLLVDHSSRIPNIGDYFLAEFGHESVIVTRTHENEIKAYYNVCRHRGSRICLKQEGATKLFRCPYHSWVYNLDGSLRAARAMPEGFDKEANSLIHVHVRLFSGLIFLNFSPDAPPNFADYTARFAPLVAGLGLPEAKIAARKIYRTKANWKLVVENFFECYHCQTAHPTYCSVHDKMKLLAFGGSANMTNLAHYQAKLAEWKLESAAKGYVVGGFLDGANSLALQAASRLPIADGALTESVDGKPLAPLMSKMEVFDGGQLGCTFNPLGIVLTCNDHAVIFQFVPCAADVTDVKAIWLVQGAAEEGKDYHVAALMEVWDVTLREDKTITENNQLGIMSRAYRPGVYSEHEARIANFGEWYVKQMRMIP